MDLKFNDSESKQEKRINIYPGLSIGRKLGDITLSDPKVSSRHARIDKIDGKFFIVDLGSTNKLIYQGITAEKLELYPGLEFLIGDTAFEVVGEHAVKLTQHWSESFSEILTETLNLATQKSKLVQACSENLSLDVSKGPNKGKSFFLAYTPVTFSNQLSDHCLYDWNIGDCSFEILQEGASFRLITSFPDKVLVNNQSLASVKIKTGDIISIGETELVFCVGTK